MRTLRHILLLAILVTSFACSSAKTVSTEDLLNAYDLIKEHCDGDETVCESRLTRFVALAHSFQTLIQEHDVDHCLLINNVEIVNSLTRVFAGNCVVAPYTVADAKVARIDTLNGNLKTCTVNILSEKREGNEAILLIKCSLVYTVGKHVVQLERESSGIWSLGSIEPKEWFILNPVAE